jgi:hypothetical protein
MIYYRFIIFFIANRTDHEPPRTNNTIHEYTKIILSNMSQFDALFVEIFLVFVLVSLKQVLVVAWL